MECTTYTSVSLGMTGPSSRSPIIIVISGLMSAVYFTKTELLWEYLLQCYIVLLILFTMTVECYSFWFFSKSQNIINIIHSSLNCSIPCLVCHISSFFCSTSSTTQLWNNSWETHWIIKYTNQARMQASQGRHLSLF